MCNYRVSLTKIHSANLPLSSTLLKGVPTNAQLTLTLLRIGEANHAPIPPPPRINSTPPDKPAQITSNDLATTGPDAPLNASQGEIDRAITYDPRTKHQNASPSVMVSSPDEKQHKKSNKILSFFRGAARGAVKTAVEADTIRAKTLGGHHARDRLGAVPPAEKVPISVPVEFEARYEGKKGQVVLSTMGTVPMVAFVEEKHKRRDDGDLHAIWSVPVADIVELVKVGGYGWKSKLVVGWSLEREVNDGLIIRDDKGGEYKVMALPLRDELFNRLISMGGQKWESW